MRKRQRKTKILGKHHLWLRSIRIYFLLKLSKEKGEVWLSEFLKQVKKKNCYSDCSHTLPVQDNQRPVSIEPLPTHHGPEEPFKKEIKPCIR